MFCNAEDRAGLVVGATERAWVQISKNRAAGLPALRHGISTQFKKAGIDRAATRRHPCGTGRNNSHSFCFCTILTDEDREVGNFVDDTAADAEDRLSGATGIISEGKPGR
jgi:hypothetical protein